MTDRDQDDVFGDLAPLWRTQGAPEIEDLEAQVQRSMARVRLLSLLEFLIAVLGTSFGVWAILKDEVFIGLAAVVFAGVSLLLVLDDRRRDRQGLIEPVSSQLRSLYRLERRRYRRGWYGIVVAMLAEGFVTVAAVSDPGMLARLDGQMVLIGATVFALTGLVYSVRQVLVGRLACERIEALSGELQ